MARSLHFTRRTALGLITLAASGAVVSHASASIFQTPLAYTASLTDPNAQITSSFGRSAAVLDANNDGFDDVIVGAPNADGTVTGAGALFLYLGSSVGLSSTPAWSYYFPNEGRRLGGVLAAIGDVNNDGFKDFAVGNPDADTVHIFLGDGSGFGTKPAQDLSGGTGFGTAIASAGDINDDGRGDLIIGAPFETNAGGMATGAAYVYYGVDGSFGEHDLRLEGGVDGSEFGSAFAAIDIDGNGFDDVIIGARMQDGAFTEGGSISVHMGAAGGLTPTAAAKIDGERDAGRFGQAIGVGDFNVDGFGDVIVGAPNASMGNSAEGRVRVFAGSAAGLATTAVNTYEGNSNSAQIGRGFAVGDVNGDLVDDAIVSLAVGTRWVFFGEAGNGLGGIADNVNVYGIGSAMGLHGPPNSEVMSHNVMPDAKGPKLTDLVAVGDFNGDLFASIVQTGDGVLCVGACFDKDGDCFNDVTEVSVSKANLDPNNPDTDGDGCKDGVEGMDTDGPNIAWDGLKLPADTSVCDFDGDGLTNGDEMAAGTDPNDFDTDDDGLPDGKELAWNVDTDMDGDINADDPDSDDDMLFDGLEMGLACGLPDTDLAAMVCLPDFDAGATTTNPLVADTDGSGVPDGLEDTNHNGVVDGTESDPLTAGDDGCEPSLCASGKCGGAICCDTACDGPCEACTAALTGGVDGVCGPVLAGTDPGDDCADEGAVSCGLNGMCNGAGACQIYAAGTTCDANACSMDEVGPGECDGAGECVPTTTTSCDDGNECTEDGCTTGDGCTHTSVYDGTPCEGGTCVAGDCQPFPGTANGGGSPPTGGEQSSGTNGAGAGSAEASGTGGGSAVGPDAQLSGGCTASIDQREPADLSWLLVVAGLIGWRRRRS